LIFVEERRGEEIMKNPWEATVAMPYPASHERASGSSR
jgi:hypothetical protein